MPFESPSVPQRLFAPHGRRNETRTLYRLLSDAQAKSGGALLLHREARVEKPALVDYRVSRALGMRLYQDTGVDSDLEFAHAGLQPLCGPFLTLLHPLPANQRDSCAIVVGLDSDPAPNTFRVGFAALSLLSDVGEDGPHLSVVDDAEWLDHPSARTISFVTRRLNAEATVLLVAVRVPAADLTGRLDTSAAPVIRRVQAGPWLRQSGSGLPLRNTDRPITTSSAVPSGRQGVLESPDRELNSAASTFMAHRPKMFGIAYRMLGSVADAEDLVQNVWLRWQNCDRDVVREPAAFLAVTTTRLAINALQSARARHEMSIGAWPQEQLSPLADPGLAAERAESLAQAVRLLLAKLSPAERAAFILREAFGYPYERIAGVVHASEASARQLVSRARKRLGSERDATVHPLEHRRLFRAIVAAADTGDMGALERVLVPQDILADVRIVA